MSEYWILVGGRPKQVDLMTWARFMETNGHRVALTHLNRCRVSTVFLGVDHNWGSGPPILFETMVFADDGEDLFMERYATLQQAIAGHRKITSRFRMVEADARNLSETIGVVK